MLGMMIGNQFPKEEKEHDNENQKERCAATIN